MHAFILHAHTRPEQAEAFEQLFRAYVEPSRAEPGCIEYHMLRDVQDPTLFIFYEVWASREALAEHMAGSEPAFAEIMNAEAKRLGMTETNFMNATGLPDPAHLTSAHDMAVLARAIIRDNAQYYPIYAEKEFTYNGIKQGNRNALLYTDPTVDGLKTGHTNAAGAGNDSAQRAGRAERARE